MAFLTSHIKTTYPALISESLWYILIGRYFLMHVIPIFKEHYAEPIDGENIYENNPSN